MKAEEWAKATKDAEFNHALLYSRRPKFTFENGAMGGATLCYVNDEGCLVFNLGAVNEAEFDKYTAAQLGTWLLSVFGD